MAEPQNSTALVPQSIEGDYVMELKEFTPGGVPSKFNVSIPSTLDSTSASVMLRAAILKRTTWAEHPFPFVILAVMYSDRMGLDILAGDVYSPSGSGRLSTTANAKIRHAMSSGKIEGYSIDVQETGKLCNIPWKAGKEEGIYTGPDLKAVVTVHVKGWPKPVQYDSLLSEWFEGRNPNWRSRPAYMLRRNALSKALEEVVPMGVEAEDAPPTFVAPPPAQTSGLTGSDPQQALAAAKAAIENKQ